MPDNRAMSNADFALPIDAVLPDVIAALRDTGRVVLQAPPGAGKTTRVPLAMLDARLTQGRILMLEPRRLAARAAAARMAESLGISIDLQLPDGGKQVVQSCDHGRYQIPRSYCLW